MVPCLQPAAYNMTGAFQTILLHASSTALGGSALSSPASAKSSGMILGVGSALCPVETMMTTKVVDCPDPPCWNEVLSSSA